MGQHLAKRQVEDGLKLYNEQKHEAAVRKWRQALRKISRSNRQERFVTLGYLAAAHCEFGRFRDMLIFSIQQIDLANEADNSNMRAEAYLNLARSNENLSEYHKAVSYCRHSLQNTPKDPRLQGYVLLCMGNAYFGFSNFSRALEHYDQAMQVAKRTNDKILELQIFNSLGKLFTLLKDYDKGMLFHNKASDIAQSFSICDTSSKYYRVTQLHMAVVMVRQGHLTEAWDCCEDALKMAEANGDKPVQAKCLSCFADIYRLRHDPSNAYPRYKAALGILIDVGDRYGQIEALSGMARTLVLMRETNKVCDCKALSINQKALALAENIVNKLFQLKCHKRIEELYRSLGDFENMRTHVQLSNQLIEEMELFCGLCGISIGKKEERLEALPCAHLFHSKCVTQHKKSTTNALSFACPLCSKSQRIGKQTYV